jgi:hypothetical protein
MSNIKVFDGHGIRAQWDAEKEDWFFSVSDVAFALAESTAKDRSGYWRSLKRHLKEEGSNLLDDIIKIKMQTDGGPQEIDVVNTKGILRLVQSIPSPKAEPFKMWLAQIGSDQLDEMADPEKAILRGADYYRQKGYTEGWINQRLQTIEMRKELTDEWKNRGIELEKEYAILTNEMTEAWSGMTIPQYKALKNLKKESLRDNMTNIELTLNQLAEVTTTALSKQLKPISFNDNRVVAREGGGIAERTREDIENRLGSPVVTSLNAKTKKLLEMRTDNDENE